MFSIPAAATFDLRVSRIGRIWFKSNSNSAIRPIRDNKKSTGADTGIEKVKSVKSKPYSWVSDGYLDFPPPFPINISEQSL